MQRLAASPLTYADATARAHALSRCAAPVAGPAPRPLVVAAAAHSWAPAAAAASPGWV